MEPRTHGPSGRESTFGGGWHAWPTDRCLNKVAGGRDRKTPTPCDFLDRQHTQVQNFRETNTSKQLETLWSKLDTDHLDALMQDADSSHENVQEEGDDTSFDLGLLAYSLDEANAFQVLVKHGIGAFGQQAKTATPWRTCSIALPRYRIRF